MESGLEGNSGEHVYIIMSGKDDAFAFFLVFYRDKVGDEFSIEKIFST